jgi:glycosyltransferase involved in cell wall biosynthesis
VIGCDVDELRRRSPLAAWDGSVRCTGYLSPEDVSAWLASSDLLLAPFDEGVSTRRGSVVAALAHRLPVISTRGTATDGAVFEHGGIALADAADHAGFIAAVERLVASEEAREAMRTPAAALYEREFTWPRIAERIMQAYGV